MKTANRTLKTIERLVSFMAGQEENLPGLDDDTSDRIIGYLDDETATALSVTNHRFNG